MPHSARKYLPRAESYHSNTVVFLLSLGLFIASCSGNTTNNVGPDPNVSGFKNATVDNQAAGPGPTTLLTLPFTAPSDGFVSITATGSCDVVETLPVSSVLNVEIETTAADTTPHPGDGAFLVGGSSADPSQGSFAAMRVTPVSAGENMAYLVIENPSTGGRLACSASMTALFQSHHLP